MRQFLNVFMVFCSTRDTSVTTRLMYNDIVYSYHGKLQVPRNVSLSSRYCNLGMYSVPTKEKKWENWLVKKEKGERKDNEVLSIWAKTSKNVASSWRQMTLESYTHLELQVGKTSINLLHKSTPTWLVNKHQVILLSWSI